MEGGWRRESKRRMDRSFDPGGSMVLTIGSAEVIGQARGEFALEAGRKRRVGHRGAEIRGKAAGKELAEAEALSSGRIGGRNRGGNEAGIGIEIGRASCRERVCQYV